MRHVVVTVTKSTLTLGAAKLRQWRLPAMADPNEFWYYADRLSHVDADLADMVNSHWVGQDMPSEYGDLVLFDRLAIDTAADVDRKALRRLGEYLLSEFGNRVSVMLLKAFPLEYEGELGPDHADRRDLYQRRQKAMLRLYRSELGVERFASSAGEVGWMWRTFQGCPAPSETSTETGRPPNFFSWRLKERPASLVARMQRPVRHVGDAQSVAKNRRKCQKTGV